MKRILIASAVLAVSAAVYFFMSFSGADEKPAPVAARDPKSPYVDPRMDDPRMKDPEFARKFWEAEPKVKVFTDYGKIPPKPTEPPAGWVQPKFAEPVGRLIEHPPRTIAPGDSVVSRVVVGGETHEWHPNSVGEMGRTIVGHKTKVPFAVGYPFGKPGEVIVAVAEDGGALGRGVATAQAALNKDLTAEFEFETGGRDGLYRVTVRRGADTKALTFWSGPLPYPVNDGKPPPPPERPPGFKGPLPPPIVDLTKEADVRAYNEYLEARKKFEEEERKQPQSPR